MARRQQDAQAGILALAGYDLHRAYVGDFKQPAREQRKQALRQGRSLLHRLTGRDLGYDLADWWNHLTACVMGFHRVPAFPRIVRAVRAAMTDPARQKLVEEVIAEDALNPAADPPVQGE
jgi:hypothetical protein